MKIRAVIFDVYGTLLQVGPPPADADALWGALFQEVFQAKPPMGWLEFSVACNRAISLRHTAAKARGVLFPEILWPAIVAEVLPGFARLDAVAQGEFVFRQIQIGRGIGPTPGAGETLHWMRQKKCLMGIASNAQAYTLRELEKNLVKPAVFDQQLCFWSFQHGFSKPNPHVFQILRAQLEARGISAGEALMVGDRLDNDVEPARAHGLQAWHLCLAGDGAQAGGWSKLDKFLARAV